LSELLEEAGVQPRGARPWREAARGRGDDTLPVLITLALERLNRHVPGARTQKAVTAAQSLRDEVGEILGSDGVILHWPHPRVAPRHGGTVGRAWVLTSAAAFNLLGLPVTEVPLGLNPRGLPLGVQVAAADGNDRLTIAAALALEKRFGGWVPPPVNEAGSRPRRSARLLLDPGDSPGDRCRTRRWAAAPPSTGRRRTGAP